MVWSTFFSMSNGQFQCQTTFEKIGSKIVLHNARLTEEDRGRFKKGLPLLEMAIWILFTQNIRKHSDIRIFVVGFGCVWLDFSPFEFMESEKFD